MPVGSRLQSGTRLISLGVPSLSSLTEPSQTSSLQASEEKAADSEAGAEQRRKKRRLPVGLTGHEPPAVMEAIQAAAADAGMEAPGLDGQVGTLSLLLASGERMRVSLKACGNRVGTRCPCQKGKSSRTSPPSRRPMPAAEFLHEQQFISATQGIQVVSVVFSGASTTKHHWQPSFDSAE